MSKARDDPVIATYTNVGYLPTTLNWFESLRRVGLAERALVFALTRRTRKALEKHGVPCRLLGQSSLPSCGDRAVKIHDSGWREIVMRKLQIVGQLLRDGQTVLFSDADVVFLRDPLGYLAEQAEPYELSIQQDRMSKSRPNVKPDWRLCTGFFYVRPTAKTLRLFDLERNDIEDFANDQPLLNARIAKDKIHVRRLPIELFPNGRMWYRRHAELDEAYIVHFNWIRGDKLPAMERYGLRFHFDGADFLTSECDGA